MRAHSIVFLFMGLGASACWSDDDQPMLTVEVQNMSQRLTAVLVDDSLGVACMKRNVSTTTGHTVTTTTYIGACMAASDIPALAQGSLKEPFDITEYVDDIIIDDDNGIVCLKVQNQFKGCVAQAKLNLGAIESLRKLAN